MTTLAIPGPIGGKPDPDDERRCHAKSKETGKRCGRWSVKGARVCVVHGGRSPHVKSKAMSRLMDMQPKAMDRLQEILNNSQDERVVLQAVNMILERLGVNADALADDGVAMDMFIRRMIEIRAEMGKPIPERFQHYVEDDGEVVDAEIVEDDEDPTGLTAEDLI